MRLHITHTTRYRYSRPVILGPHLVRLHPRYDHHVRLENYQLTVNPTPSNRTRYLDPWGNLVDQLWFQGPTESLTIQSEWVARNHNRNPFDYLVDRSLDQVPILYPDRLERGLRPYLVTNPPVAEITQALSREIAAKSGQKLLGFVCALNGYLYQNIERIVREQGRPQRPETTLETGRGACRDLAVLFLALCRAQGLAARFVSGYQHRDTPRQRRYLHAWPEVFVPGGGWRGFDPTHGLAVADRHIAVAAAADPSDASPIDGTFSGTAQSDMEVQLRIETIGG
ncbi:MAG: transglutaminase family protein [Pseudomonadota bacterium]|nr:transglutaminase family protein [Pseudomonadota bacterium]